MLLQRRLARVIIVRIKVAFIRHQRHFGVNHHIFTLRQPHDHIRLHSRAGVVFDTHLRFVFISFPQSRGLQHAGQHHFSPVALGFVIPFQRAGQVDRFLRHLRIQLLEIANLMRQRVPLAGFLTKAVLHLTAKTVQLFAQRRQQAVEALAVLFVNAAVAVLKNSVGEVLKLFAEALLAVDHLADFVFRMQLGGFKTGSDFAEIGLQRGVDISQVAQLVVEQLALLSPVFAQGKLLLCRT